MTHTRHNYEMMFEAHRRVVKGHKDINTRINIKATNRTGMKAILLFYRSGIFNVTKRIKP